MWQMKFWNITISAQLVCWIGGPLVCWFICVVNVSALRLFVSSLVLRYLVCPFCLYFPSVVRYFFVPPCLCEFVPFCLCNVLLFVCLFVWFVCTVRA